MDFPLIDLMDEPDVGMPPVTGSASPGAPARQPDRKIRAAARPACRLALRCRPTSPSAKLAAVRSREC